jgi:hypothetical protein
MPLHYLAISNCFCKPHSYRPAFFGIYVGLIMIQSANERGMFHDTVSLHPWLSSWWLHLTLPCPILIRRSPGSRALDPASMNPCRLCLSSSPNLCKSINMTVSTHLCIKCFRLDGRRVHRQWPTSWVQVAGHDCASVTVCPRMSYFEHMCRWMCRFKTNFTGGDITLAWKCHS